MTNIIFITNPEDKDGGKITWLIKELKKRDLEVIQPELPHTSSYKEWDVKFKNIVEAFAPDTIVFIKGKAISSLLKEYEERPLGVKGTIILTDNTTVFEDKLSLNYEKINKKSIKFFVYAFKTTTDFSEKQSGTLADKLEASLFTLEGAEDNSDYEDILIDILSLIEQ